MADLNLYKALAANEQLQIKRADLDSTVNHLAQYTLEQKVGFGLSSIFFKYGQPGKTPSGNGGYILYGTNDIYKRPMPDPLDHRISPRSGEIPIHEIDYGSLYMVESKVTDFYGRNMLDMLKPEVWVSFHIAALMRTLPHYFMYLIYSVFVSTAKRNREGAIKKGATKYIEPTDGSTAGYKFMNSEGYMQINLKPVIAKEKKTDNDLKKKLEDMNKALRNDTRKHEIDTAQDKTLDTNYKKSQLTEEGKKALALYQGIERFTREALELGYLDKKYKHKKEDFEGFDVNLTTDNCFVIMSTDTTYELEVMTRLTSPSQGSISLNKISGVPLYPTPLLDKDEAFLIHKDLLQFWVIPQTRRYIIDRFNTEQTVDYIYQLGHTISMNELFPSVGFKLKQ